MNSTTNDAICDLMVENWQLKERAEKAEAENVLLTGELFAFKEENAHLLDRLAAASEREQQLRDAIEKWMTVANSFEQEKREAEQRADRHKTILYRISNLTDGYPVATIIKLAAEAVKP